ncbi:MAG: sugar phosphate nucleotidyltransferase, partial [archaeon]|nr:sugar phosphate nucleotidyltransferase [archaeon]
MGSSCISAEQIDMADITKAIIPVAGMGTRFLPLSKVTPKEFFPLVGKPLIQYAVEEAKASGVKEIIFVVNSNKKTLTDYFKRSPKLERVLQDGGKDDLLEQLKSIEKLVEGMTFSFVTQREQAGDGHAVLQAKRLVGNEPCFMIYPDDVIEAKTPALAQIAQVFRTSEKPVISLFTVSKERLPTLGVVEPERIARKLHKVRKIVEKPAPDAIPSDLAVVGRHVLTSDVFAYLKKAKPNKRGEISLTEALGEMVKDGKIIYGYEVEGRWWDCGTMPSWLKSQLYFTLTSPEYGP